MTDSGPSSQHQIDTNVRTAGPVYWVACRMWLQHTVVGAAATSSLYDAWHMRLQLVSHVLGAIAACRDEDVG